MSGLLTSFVGGLLIGAAVALLAIGIGRVAGISGIAATTLSGNPGPDRWRLAFLAGLFSAGVLFAPPSVTQIAPPLVMIAAGLLVGIGTRIASGCTSGHGVCGLANRSPRSLVATLTFIASGALTVFVVRHGWPA